MIYGATECVSRTRRLPDKGVEMNRDDVTFYVGHETIIPREGHRGIPRW